jgi:hypothetical protein
MPIILRLEDVMKRFTSLKLIAIALLINSGIAFSADPPVPTTSFGLIGYIQKFEMCKATDQIGNNPSWCTNPGGPKSGAIMKVNGIRVIIPNNSYIVMPGSYLKPKDIFDMKLPGTPAGQSGLALEDTPPPPFPYVADLIGNIVDGVYIAGLVNIMQIPLQTSSGFIKAISNTGELLIGPDKDNPAVSTHVRLNDPNIDPSADPKINPDPGTGSGRYGKAQSPDTRFKADQENPTVHAATGYPMCVPEPANPECLASNRPPVAPDGSGSRRFTVGATAALSDAPACSACDPKKMIPLAIGDFVTYTGILVKDPTTTDPNATYVSASALEADLGVYTEKGKDPAYVFIEEALEGTGGTAFPGLDQETGPGKVLPGQTLVTRFRIVGFTTDPSRNVNVFALDALKPLAEGKFTERLLSSVQPEQVAPMGRFRITVDQQVFMPPTREIRARIQGIVGSNVPTTPPTEPLKAANGLIYGEYTAPVAEYIFPEGRVFGAKKPQPGFIPANFEDLCFLSRGWWPDGEAAPLEPLTPWPSSGHEQLSGLFCQ